STVTSGTEPHTQEDSTESSSPEKRVGPHMFATIRRYDAIDQERTSELVKKADETLVPSLTDLPGFNGYCLIEAGNGVFSSIGFYDTGEPADEYTPVATNWVREQKLEDVLPNAPTITTGEVVVQKMGELVQA